jgi:uncharacterized delta-60 repeat protein
MARRVVWFVLVWFVIAGSALAQYWQADASFAPVIEGTGDAASRQITASPGGKSLVAGPYAVNGLLAEYRLLRLNADGSIDSSFAAPKGDWRVLAVYPNGRVLAQQSTGSTGSKLVRLLSDGSLDPSFTSATASASSARLLADGRVLLFGTHFTAVGGIPRAGLAVLGENGELSLSFVPQLKFSSWVGVHDVLPLPDGRFVVMGNFTNFGGSSEAKSIARLNADGSIDSSFRASVAGYEGRLFRSSVPDTILAAEIASGGASKIVRLNASGTPDSGFAAELVGVPYAFGEQQADGKIYYVTRNNNGWELRRINANGTADSAFVVQSFGLPSLADDGTFFVPDPVTTERRAQHFLVSRLMADGSLDTNYRPRIASSGSVWALARQPDGKTLIRGWFSFVNGLPKSSFVRINADGTLDGTFVTAPEHWGVGAFALQPSGKIVAEGVFQPGASERTTIRFNSNGTPDPTFSSFPSPILSSLAIDPAGRIYQSNFNSLVRYTAEGAVDNTFHSAVTNPRKMAPFADGIAVVDSQNKVVRLRENGTIDPTFVVDRQQLPADIWGLVPLPDGRLLAYSYGHFTRLARSGAADFIYIPPSTDFSYGITPAVRLVLAGVLFDLLRDANAAPGYQAHADHPHGFYPFGPESAVDLGASGQLMFGTTAAESPDPPYPYSPLVRYTRVATGEMTFDPRPTIQYQSRKQPFGSLQGATQTLEVTGGGLFPLSYQWLKDGVPIPGATSNIFTLGSVRLSDAGVYTVAVSNAHGTATSAPMRMLVNDVVVPVTIFAQPGNASTGMGGSAAFTTAAVGNPVPVIQWYFNGTAKPATSGWTQISNLSATVHSTFALSAIEIANAGIYTAQASGGGAIVTTPAILGITTAQKLAGTAQLVGTDVAHPNGNIFDQVLAIGAAAAITADAGQVTRLSFVDLDDDIVQIELSGAGTLSLVFDAASGPAKPVKYSQDVLYMKGHAGIVVAGANETTNVSVFSVGRLTAFDPTGAFNFLQPVSSANNPANNGSPLFHGQANTVYDGVADLAFVAISSADGKFGGLRTANASYFATKGITGVYAPGVNFSGPLFVGDIRAFDAATPMLVIGSSPDTRVTGGDLFQDNGRAVQVNGLTQLKFTGGGDSHGHPFAARTNLARLEQNGSDVTPAIVVNPTP